MIPATFVFERLAALIHQLVREDAARHGLLPVHLQVLSYLAQANRYSDLPIAVADYLGITRGTVSQTLSVLERRGLIVREADSRHGKRIHLVLTTAGEAILAASWPRRVDQALRAAGNDPEVFAEDLRRVLAALQRLNRYRVFGQCRQCAHFIDTGDGYRCGLTGETLSCAQTIRVCREWSAPEPDEPSFSPGGGLDPAVATSRR